MRLPFSSLAALVVSSALCAGVIHGQGASQAPASAEQNRTIVYRPHAADRARSPLLAGIHLTAQQNAALDALDSVYTSRIAAILDAGTPSSDAMQRVQTLYAEYTRRSRNILTVTQRAIFESNQTKFRAESRGGSTYQQPISQTGNR